MKLTIGTELMKDVMSRAIKGVGNNKLLPITQMICVSLKDVAHPCYRIPCDAVRVTYTERELAGSEALSVRGVGYDALTCCHAVENVVLAAGKGHALRHLGVLISLNRKQLLAVACAERINDSRRSSVGRVGEQ